MEEEGDRIATQSGNYSHTKKTNYRSVLSQSPSNSYSSKKCSTVNSGNSIV